MENILKDMKHTLFALLIAGMIGGVSACSNERKETDSSASTNTGKAYQKDSDASASTNDAETTDNAENSWMLERDQYVAGHKDMLRKIDTKISESEQSMEKMNAKSKSAMKESINSLKLKRDQFEDKLNNVGQATQANWSDMKQEVDEKATELDMTYKAFDKEY